MRMTCKPDARTRRPLMGMVLVLILWTSGTVGAAVPAELFQPLEGKPLLLGDSRPAVIRSRPVQVRFDLLAAGERAYAQREPVVPLHLNLFPGVGFPALPREIIRTPGRATVWKGRLPDIPASSFTLIYTDTHLFGNITLPGAFYQVRPAGEGRHAVLEIGQRAYPPEKDPRPVAGSRENPAWLANRGGLGSAPARGDRLAAVHRIFLPLLLAPPYVDVLVVYTPQARAAAGGSTAMRGLIELAVHETNTGYDHSGVRQILRLAHAEEVAYSEAGFDWDTTLDRLTDQHDGYLDQVHTLRDEHRADLVVLLVDDYTYCGLAWLMTAVSPSFASSAFSLVNWDCATGIYSLAHEMGHNMGSHHNWEETDEIGAFPYSKGYQAPNRAFRTIMAYDCPGGCTRINYWSNPDSSYQGQATGRDYQAYQPADNRRSLNQTTPTVGSWR